MNVEKWYRQGLAFQCQGCGNCCSGPDEGFVWITRPEIQLLAEKLNMPPGQLRKKYLRRYFNRVSLIEHPETKDCIFLKNDGGQKSCDIYEVRPNQCRTWPFWNSNLKSSSAWNYAAQNCPGINRGKLFTFEEIERIRKQKQWHCNNDDQHK
jgi:hypothetical protein